MILHFLVSKVRDYYMERVKELEKMRRIKKVEKMKRVKKVEKTIGEIK